MKIDVVHVRFSLVRTLKIENWGGLWLLLGLFGSVGYGLVLSVFLGPFYLSVGCLCFLANN